MVLIARLEELDEPDAEIAGEPAPRAASLTLVASLSNGTKSLAGTYGAASAVLLKKARPSIAIKAPQ